VVVYVTEQGATVGKQRGLIVISKGGSELQRVHLVGLEQILIFGQVQLSTQALRALLANGTDTVLLTMSGRFLGRLSSGLSKNIGLRRQQFQKLASPSEVLALCRAYVSGKLRNSLALLRRYNRALQSDLIARDAAAIRACIDDVALADTPNQIRGLEGAGAARYFSALRSIFRAPGLAFFRRARRPPPDPINILLSLGYTLLGNLLHGLCEGAGLDPYLGALHEPRYGRPSLALDLIEELRPVIVDTAAIRAVNTRAILAADFEEALPEEVEGEDRIWAEAQETGDDPAGVDPEDLPPRGEETSEAGPPRRVKITSAGLKKWLLAFERRLDEVTFYEGTGTRLSYRQILREQVYRLARHLRGERPYQPFLSRD
jgi:CRISPR-associated protein Cas1